MDGAAKWAAAVQLLSWYMQIHPGHMVLEKRKPALMDSMVQVRFFTTPQSVFHRRAFNHCQHSALGSCMPASKAQDERPPNYLEEGADSREM